MKRTPSNRIITWRFPPPDWTEPFSGEKDFIRFAGHPVEVSLYKGIDGKKHYTGELVGWQDGNLVLIGEKGVTLSFPEEAVAKTKLLVIF